MKTLQKQRGIGKVATEAHRERIANIKNDLPKDWRERVIRELPEYDSLKGAARMNNVFMLLASDSVLTPIMEKIAAQNKNTRKQNLAV